MENSRQTTQNTRYDLFYLNPLQKYRLHWCLWSTEDGLWVCHAQEWRLCFSTWAAQHGAAVLWFPKHSKCEQQKVPAGSQACWDGQGRGSSGSLFQPGFCCYCLQHSRWGLLPLIAAFKAQLLSPLHQLQSQRRWVQRVPGAWLGSRAVRGVTKHIPSPLTRAPSDQPEKGAAALGWMDVL